MQAGTVAEKSAAEGQLSGALGRLMAIAEAYPDLKANQNMTHSSQIRLRIADGLSGIASYSGRIDGKWVLFEYDAKNALIYYTFDGGIASGAHILDVEVVDQKNNKATLSLPFTR